MPDQIVTIAEIQRRARVAFESGKSANSCPLPWHSDAYRTWHEEYDRLLRTAVKRLVEAAPHIDMLEQQP